MTSAINAISRPLEILIVDDCPEHIRTLIRILTLHDFKTTSANSGMAALEIINIKKPDLILLDIKMPGLDGLEVCKMIKANPDTEKLPIIFVTALDSIEDKVRGFAAGASDYITKPFYPDEVAIRVKNIIALSHHQKGLL